MKPRIEINQNEEITIISSLEKQVVIKGNLVTVNNGLVVKVLSDNELLKISQALLIYEASFNAIPNLALEEVLYNNSIDNAIFIKAKNGQQCVVAMAAQTEEHKAMIQNFHDLMDIRNGKPINSINWRAPSTIILDGMNRFDVNIDFNNQEKQSVAQMAFVCMQILARENNLPL